MCMIPEIDTSNDAQIKGRANTKDCLKLRSFILFGSNVRNVAYLLNPPFYQRRKHTKIKSEIDVFYKHILNNYARVHNFESKLQTRSGHGS